mgnify:CR=1 FL=1
MGRARVRCSRQAPRPSVCASTAIDTIQIRTRRAKWLPRERISYLPSSGLGFGESRATAAPPRELRGRQYVASAAEPAAGGERTPTRLPLVPNGHRNGDGNQTHEWRIQMAGAHV